MNSKTIALAVGGAAVVALAAGAFVILSDGAKNSATPSDAPQAAQAESPLVDTDLGDAVVLDAELIESIAATDTMSSAHAPSEASDPFEMQEEPLEAEHPDDAEAGSGHGEPEEAAPRR